MVKNERLSIADQSHDVTAIQVDDKGRIILVADRAQLIVLLQMLTELPEDRWPSDAPAAASQIGR